MATDRSLEKLMTEHGPAVARVAALYEFDATEREDLVQDIWLAIWRALPRFRGDSSARTFVFRIAHNRAVSHVHRRRRAPKPVSEPRDREEPAADPARSYELSETMQSLLRALRTLPVIDRQIVQMSLEGLRQAEIGEVLGISEGNVAVRLNRARARLRQRMERTR